MAYIEVSNYLEYAHIETYDSDDETRWSNLIGRATGIIETITGRNFEATATTGTSDAPVTRYFDASSDVMGSFLFFDKDICEITTVSNGDSDSTTVTTDQYVTEPRNDAPYYAIKLRGSSGVYWTYDDDEENAIAIAGIWAYSKTPPNDIKHACLRLTKWLEDQRKTDIDLDRPVLAGEGSVILPQRLPADIVSILQNYKAIRMGA